jgi:putative ABC transport system ATP-binding protein
LVPALTAGENILLPLRLAGHALGRERTDRAIDAVGLPDRRVP